MRSKPELKKLAQCHILGTLRACALQGIREEGGLELELEVEHQYERICRFFNFAPIPLDEF